MSLSFLSRQWRQLAAIIFAHTVVDFYVGCLTPLLIPMRDRFHLPLALMIFIVTLIGFSSNIFQVLIGNIRTRWRSPVLILIGIFLAGGSVIVPNLPVAGYWSAVGMIVIVILAGAGVAAVHPEGLRAVQGLREIPSAISTPSFMVFGFLGFAGGSYAAAAMTEHLGLQSLLWLYLLAPIAAHVVYWSRIRLPIEREGAEEKRAQQENMPRFPFFPLFLGMSFLAFSSQLQATLLPSYLYEELGFSLSFGGLSFTLFGVGGMLGSLFWGAVAVRKGIWPLILFLTIGGVPLTIFYLWAVSLSPYLILLLAFTGFIVYAGFPFSVTLSRYAKTSLRQSQRMGWASGGTWGIAAIAVWCISPFVSKFGMGPVLHLVWVGYLFAFLLLLYCGHKISKFS